MHHQRFDLTHWQQLFPDKLLADDSFSALDSIFGPRDVCRFEYFRRQAQSRFDLGSSVDADIFIFALGEPADRSVTKIGGVPYRPAGLPWPRWDSFAGDDNSAGWFGRLSKKVRLDLETKLEWWGGEARDWNDKEFLAMVNEEYGSKDVFLDEEFPKLRFLAQFNFADSRDLVGSLPGDVLLLFGNSPTESPFVDHYEWYPLGLTDLVEASDVPHSGYVEPKEQVVCYGHRYRTCDYPDAEERNAGQDTTFRRDWPFRLKATRIGGAPYFPQDGTKPPGRFVCALDGFSILNDHPWPMLNLEDGDDYQGNGAWWDTYVGCSGSVYIYIGDDGQLRWYDECT